MVLDLMMTTVMIFVLARDSIGPLGLGLVPGLVGGLLGVLMAMALFLMLSLREISILLLCE